MSAHAAPLSRLTEEVIAIVDRIGVQVMRERAERLGDTEGGLYGYYRARLNAGRALQDYEIDVANLILSQLEPRPVVEIGSGWGFLAAALALAGLEVHSVERDNARFAAQQAFVDALAEDRPEVAGRLMAHCAAFPDLDESVPREARLVFTNLVTTTTPEQRRRIVDGVTAYPAALFDALRFFGEYYGDGQVEASLEPFRASGLSPRRMLSLPGLGGEYYAVAPRGPAQAASIHAAKEDHVTISETRSGTATADELNAFAVDFLTDRLARMESWAAGLGPYYERRQETGEALNSVDLALGRALSDFHAELPLVEIGSGICFLPALISLTGRKAIAVEGNTERADAQDAFVAAARARFGVDLTHITGLFPDCLDQLPKQSVLLFTNVAAQRPPEVRRAMAAALKQFAFTVFDAMRFVGEFYKDDEIEQSLAVFRELGFDPQPFLRLPATDGAYYVISGTP